MINLLPPVIKEQVAYSKKSLGILRYFKLAVFVALVLGGSFFAADWYLSAQIADKQKTINEQQEKIAQYAGVEAQVKALNAKLTSISNASKSQSKFSVLLSDFGAHMPKGAYITAVALTGDDKKPLGVSVNANSYQSAVAVRAALASSPRVSGVDVSSISATASEWHVDLSVGFKPGAAK